MVFYMALLFILALTEMPSATQIETLASDLDHTKVSHIKQNGRNIAHLQ